MAVAGAPVVFVHGMFLHATSWAEWVESFRAAGFAPVAPGWPGEATTVAEAREHPGQVAGKGIDDIVAHYAQLILGLDARPIVIGHSTGALIVQRLLGQDLAAAAVAIQPPPIKGVVNLAPSTARVGWIALRNPANRHRSLSLTSGQFRYAFGNAVSAAESDELYERWTIPSPGRPMFELASANFSRRSPAKVNTDHKTRGPLLLIAGGKDHGAPAAVAKATARRYRRSPAVTDYQEFADRGHSLPIDSGWRDVADAALTWVRRRVR
jgi:alpha-beta hydrolase superfamily lysophospholipase